MRKIKKKGGNKDHRSYEKKTRKTLRFRVESDK